MSRAYRIKVRESARHVLRASDHVSAHLEVLEILPPERMAELLADALTSRGFTQQGAKLVRREKDGLTIEIDPCVATVTVKAEADNIVTVEGETQGWSGVPDGKQQERDREALRKELQKDLRRQAEEKSAHLQKKVTDRLEGRLAELRKELDQAINRVTAEALKEKAASMGQIKEMTEDPATGSLTIVLEV